MFGLVVAATVADATQPGSLDTDTLLAGMIGLLMLMTALAQVVALGLGIASLTRVGCSKVFGVLGTVFASTSLLCTLLIFVGAALET